MPDNPLDSFDRRKRYATLQRYASVPTTPVLTIDNQPINMHLHTFFSFNVAGFSPSHIAVQAREWGLYAAATTDFDVLDAADEFLGACSLLSLRGASHIETRVFSPEFSSIETNSPGEPGICYVMGAGFPRTPKTGDKSYSMLEQLRNHATSRNKSIVEKINAYLPEIAVGYDNDIADLTPALSPTERHIVRALIVRALNVFPDVQKYNSFWAQVLSMPVTNLSMGDLEQQIRRHLMKKDGVAYQQPGPTSFPEIHSFYTWVQEAGAIPMAAWRDGTSLGEADPATWLNTLETYGMAAVNIVPQLSTDPSNLQELMKEIIQRQLPVNIGTEMNATGLPNWDDLTDPILAPFREVFVTGAEIMVGHTTLSRYANFPYCGTAAATEFPKRGKRNEFFAAVGRLPPPNPLEAQRLIEMGEDRAFDYCHNAVRKEAWSYD